MLQKTLSRTNKFNWRRFLWLHVKGFAVAFLVVVVCGIWPAVVVTPSINKTFFLITKHYKKFPHGSYVYFKKNRPSEDINYPIIKKVVGVSGDVITIKNNNCYVNKQLIGPIQGKTRKGAVLQAIKPGVISQGKLFVAGNIKDSFDSRYQEFGLLDKSEVVRAHAIF